MPGSQSGWSSVVRRKGFSSLKNLPGKPLSDAPFAATGIDEIVEVIDFTASSVDTKMELTMLVQ